MQRGCSTILFVLGGWMLMSGLIVAFIDVQPGLTDNFVALGVMAIIALVPLLLATVVSPGLRWRELGLTMLITVAVAAAMGVSFAAILLDPAMMRYMPPLPKADFNFPLGLSVLLVVAISGWALYRSAPDH